MNPSTHNQIQDSENYDRKDDFYSFGIPMNEIVSECYRPNVVEIIDL